MKTPQYFVLIIACIGLTSCFGGNTPANIDKNASGSTTQSGILSASGSSQNTNTGTVSIETASWASLTGSTTVTGTMASGSSNESSIDSGTGMNDADMDATLKDFDSLLDELEKTNK